MTSITGLSSFVFFEPVPAGKAGKKVETCVQSTGSRSTGRHTPQSGLSKFCKGRGHLPSRCLVPRINISPRSVVSSQVDWDEKCGPGKNPNLLIIPMCCNNEHLFGKNDWSCVHSKVDRVNERHRFPVVHKNLRKTRNGNPEAYPKSTPLLLFTSMRILLLSRLLRAVPFVYVTKTCQ